MLIYVTVTMNKYKYIYILTHTLNYRHYLYITTLRIYAYVTFKHKNTFIIINKIARYIMYEYIMCFCHLCRYDWTLSEMQVDFVVRSLKIDLFSTAYQRVTLCVTQTYRMNIVWDSTVRELWISKRVSREVWLTVWKSYQRPLGKYPTT